MRAVARAVQDLGRGRGRESLETRGGRRRPRGRGVGAVWRGGELEEFLTSLAAIATVEEDEEGDVRAPQEPSKPATNDAEALKELAELVQCLAEDGKLEGSEGSSWKGS